MLKFFSNLIQALTTPVPYKAYLPAGIKAYSKPNGTYWGITSGGVVTVGSVWLGHSRIDSPLWHNGKWYWVPVILEEYVPTEPPLDPDPDPTIYVTHRIETYSDGSITVDGVFVPNK